MARKRVEKKSTEIKEALTKKKARPKWERSKRLNTGSTLLNLACSDQADGGFPMGGYVFLVGDSRSGKTWFSLSCLAEASVDERFKDYRFIYDNVEHGAWMDLERYFGKAMAERMEPPRIDDEGKPKSSEFVEEFYFNVDSALEDGRPFIYVADSMDGMDTMADEEKFQEWKKSFDSGKEASGSFGVSKAKLNSVNLRRVVGKLEQSDSLLIIISQTRDNISPMSFVKKTRSGGHALQFYSTLEIWTSVSKKITKDHRGKKRHIGSYISLAVKKNRLTGKEVEVTIPIYHSYGIDDVGSCVDFLVAEGAWDNNRNVIIPKDKDGLEIDGLGTSAFKKAKRDTLISRIESEGKVQELRDLTQQEWDLISEAVTLKRSPRYV